MPNTILRPVAWLLHLANAHPPTLYRREFYALKDRLCRRYGRLVGEDVQHIVDRCWGYEEDAGCAGKLCRRCGGTGIWSERFILLHRWALGGRVFHRPDRTVYGPGWIPTIEGRITHEGVSRHASREAALWLALLFDRALFWRLFRSSRTHELRWCPMLALQAVVFELRRFVGRFYLRRCDTCRRWVFRYSPRVFLCFIRCRRCEEQSRAAVDQLVGGFAGETYRIEGRLIDDDHDLPF